MTSPYLLLVTGSLRSNRSRAKCMAQVGMSYRLAHLEGGRMGVISEYFSELALVLSLVDSV